MSADRSLLALPLFEERHRELADALDAWAGRHLPGLIDHQDVDASCRRLVTALGEAGFLDHAVPGEEARHDLRAICIARETLAARDGLADFAFAMQGLGSGPVALFGTAEQKRRWLAPARAGRAIAAFALTEPDSGSDVAAISLAARPDGPDHMRLDGEKTWISNGGIADTYVVFARTGEAEGARGLSTFLVEADAPGLHVAERLHTIAPHPLARLSFEGVRVPVSQRIGGPGEGFKIAMATLDVFRASVGAAALGFARAALDATLTRVMARRLFGAPLADLQTTQAAIADQVLDIEASALLVYRAAHAKDAGAERITREAALAKLAATEAAQRVIDRAVQLHGGEGVRSGSRPEVLYREIRALRIYEGASEVQKIIIARQTLAEHARGAAEQGREG
jgi:acyl-CoA dehydrogenase